MDILQYPTIAELSKALTEAPTKGEQNASPYIVKLREGTQNEVSVVIPGLPGVVDGYHEMAAKLPSDGAVYGVQMKGSMGEEPYESIEEMAAHNIEQLQKIEFSGAIRLYAHSYGGRVVYEMLRQLKGSTIAIQEVVFIECPILPSIEEMEKENIPIFCDTLINYLGIDEEQFYEKVYAIFDQPKDTWKALLLETIYASKMHMDKASFDYIWRLLEKSIGVSYTCTEQLPYQLSLVMAKENSHLSLVQVGRWEDYFAEVKRITVEGDHLSVVKSPYCYSWIEKLAAVVY